MPFRLSLYRAPEDLGPIHSWDDEHREPLGTREELKAALDGVFPQLVWEESEHMLCVSCSFNGEEHACEITLFGAPGETLLDISIYSGPPAVRVVMSSLNLNYCYALESGEMYFPFAAGDRWPGAAR
jgi:hypothetical protein